MESAMIGLRISTARLGHRARDAVLRRCNTFSRETNRAHTRPSRSPDDDRGLPRTFLARARRTAAVTRWETAMRDRPGQSKRYDRGAVENTSIIWVAKVAACEPVPDADAS
jgi:hypothetical protein